VSAWNKIAIVKRQNRSTQSAHGISDEDKKKPNPASSDSDDANLPIDSDTLKVSFSLRIVGNLGKPFGCNDPEFQRAIQEKVEEFKGEVGLKEIAFRYAYNIANGRFLWRNRVGAEEIKIHVQLNVKNDGAESKGKLLEFDAYKYSLNDFDKNRENEKTNILAKEIEKGLRGDDKSFSLIKIDAYVKLGKLQHVFPSQKMNMGEKGKVLFKLDGCAAIHNVKIGNAIRTIDTWYTRYKDEKLPIAIEPYGSVTQRGEAYRKNKKEGDLYSLMVAWVNNTDISDEKKSYVVANLIRGGVFSKKKG
jgi:CRISPR-associated protein Csy3